MFNYYYDADTGALVLDETQTRAVTLRSARPVFVEEMNLYGFDRYFDYDKRETRPFMWAEMGSFYYRGVKIARVTGGSYYEPPNLTVYENLFTARELRPIDVDATNAMNENVLRKMTAITLERIDAFINKHYGKVVGFSASYSGGKDSDVMIDLLAASNYANEIPVVFGNTGMESVDTYRHVAEVKSRCRRRGQAFYVATSDLNPLESWRMFGAPSRRMRWCCNVHKSTPVGLKIRELFGVGKTAAFVGVRAEESARRAGYDFESDEEKIKGQVAFYPILDWTLSEVWAYMLGRGVPINRSYRRGLARVGCCVCCETGGRGDFVEKSEFPEQINLYKRIIVEQDARRNPNDSESSWRTHGWKARMNGYYMAGVRRLMKFDKTDAHSLFYARDFRSKFGEWRKILGGGG